MRAVLGLVWAIVLVSGCVSPVAREAEEAKKERLIATDIQLSAGYLRQGQMDVALEKLEKALALDPDHPQANNMMALLQWRLRNYDEAERRFKTALDARPDDPETQNNYGVFLCERGRIGEAEKWFKKAIANPLYKTPAEASVNAGVCLMRKPDLISAERYLRTALRISPNHPEALYQLAKLNFTAGHVLAARGFVQRYFQVGQDTPDALLLAVGIERALRNKDEEASYALRLRNKFPNSPQARLLQRGLSDTNTTR